MDDLTQRLNAVTLTPSASPIKTGQKPRLVYVDGMNYSDKFFTVGDHWCFREARQNISKMVKHARESNIVLKVFLDAYIETDEALQKWRSRREKEVRLRTRNMPQAMNVLIGEMFSMAGIEVAYSVDADNDDTLASHAQHDRAAVMSRDKDFLRYNRASYRIYEDFTYKREYLHLIPRRSTYLRPEISKRDIHKPKPAVRSTDPGFVTLPDFYLRGSPSPLTRDCGNLHITVRSLRQAYYASLGIKTAVREEFPTYRTSDDDEGVVWLVEDVLPSDEYHDLLKSPEKAYEHYFGKLVRPDGVSNRDWDNHVYASYSVVFELCALHLGTSLFELLCTYAKQPSKMREP
ncbi:hypothetical protein F5H01DRAFT_332115 [Linnemannia elongata]|nr:hypothetical protein F5H01DRAFT_332115 [Linnemannia elongata]